MEKLQGGVILRKKSKYFENIRSLVFIVMLCFCLIIISLFEYQQIKLYRQEQAERELIILNTYASKLDDEIRNVIDYMNLLLLESSAVEFVKNDNIEQYEKIKLFEYIKKTFPYYDISGRNLIMYKPEYDCFISKNGIEHFYDIKQSYGNIPYKASDIEEMEENKLIRIMAPQIDGNENDNIIFFVKKSAVIGKNTCFLLILNKKAMTENMEKEQLNGFYIKEKDDYLFEYSLKPENDKKEIIWTNSIAFPEWEYGLKAGEFDVPFYFAVQFAITLFCLVITSLWASKYIAMKIYRPFKNFFEKYFEESSYYDEFGMIEETFDRLIENNAELGNRLGGYEARLKSSFLQDIFMGRIDENEINDKKKLISLKTDNEPCCVVCVAAILNSFDTISFNNKSYEEFLEEMAEALGAESFELSFGKTVFLYPCSKNEVAETIILKKIASAEQKLNIKIKAIMLDKQIDTLQDMCGLYTEIIEISDVYLVSMEKTVWHHGSDENKDDRYYYPIEIENRFISFIREGNREEAYKLLCHILDVNIVEKGISSEEMVEFKFALMMTARRITEIFDLEETELTNGENIREMIVFSHDQEKLKTLLCDFYNNVLSAVSAGNADRQNLLFSEINAYVMDNYEKTEEVSVVNIAARFNISVGYISKLYKKITGQTFIDYVLELRVEKAKKLLCEKLSLKVKDVAESVGYLNTSSFVRVFKMRTGVSPSEYRVKYAGNDKNDNII